MYPRKTPVPGLIIAPNMLHIGSSWVNRCLLKLWFSRDSFNVWFLCDPEVASQKRHRNYQKYFLEWHESKFLSVRYRFSWVLYACNWHEKPDWWFTISLCLWNLQKEVYIDGLTWTLFPHNLRRTRNVAIPPQHRSIWTQYARVCFYWGYTAFCVNISKDTMRLKNIHNEMKWYTKSGERLVPNNYDTSQHIGNITV